MKSVVVSNIHRTCYVDQRRYSYIYEGVFGCRLNPYYGISFEYLLDMKCVTASNIHTTSYVNR